MKVTANLSRFHPDYGLTLVEHMERKAKRAKGRLKVIPKAGIRAGTHKHPPRPKG